MFRWLLLSAVLCAGAEPPVKTEAGLVTGTAEEGIRIYRGIPYAAPPVGDLRWRAPQPVLKWEGARAADKFGPACMQTLPAGPAARTSEDCLTLNIWTPAKGADERLPVMVWIHGGAFRTGSGSFRVSDGATLAKQGVVLVTINYRLGVFGLFAHPAEQSPANFHLMDQVAALKWVQRNIGAFGGDPKKVTIFGESAGGSSVIHLMVSPEARGLFHGAIAQSGGGGRASRRLAAVEADGNRLAGDAADPLRALRALPADELMKRAAALSGETPRMGAYSPVVDGKIVPAAPGELFEKGQQATVPFLLGANDNEASLMRAFKTTTTAVLAVLGPRRAEAERIYAEETGGDADRLAAKLYGDALFVAPARFLAGTMEKVRQPAWLYHFTYVPERIRGEIPGAPHGLDVLFVFGNVGQRVPATDGDRRMAERVSAYWVQFAKTGNPNPPGKHEWPAYDRESDKLLELGTQIAVREKFRKEQMKFHEIPLLGK